MKKVGFVALSLHREITAELSPFKIENDVSLTFEPGMIGCLFVYNNREMALKSNPGSEIMRVEYEEA